LRRDSDIEQTEECLPEFWQHFHSRRVVSLLGQNAFEAVRTKKIEMRDRAAETRV
jgi:hypothetical protein